MVFQDFVRQSLAENVAGVIFFIVPVLVGYVLGHVEQKLSYTFCVVGAVFTLIFLITFTRWAIYRKYQMPWQKVYKRGLLMLNNGSDAKSEQSVDQKTYMKKKSNTVPIKVVFEQMETIHKQNMASFMKNMKEELENTFNQVVLQCEMNLLEKKKELSDEMSLATSYITVSIEKARKVIEENRIKSECCSSQSSSSFQFLSEMKNHVAEEANSLRSELKQTNREIWKDNQTLSLKTSKLANLEKYAGTLELVIMLQKKIIDLEKQWGADFPISENYEKLIRKKFSRSGKRLREIQRGVHFRKWIYTLNFSKIDDYELDDLKRDLSYQRYEYCDFARGIQDIFDVVTSDIHGESKVDFRFADKSRMIEQIQLFSTIPREALKKLIKNTN